MTLAKREATLRALLNRNASDYKLILAAQRMRDAKAQVLRARIGAMPSVIRTPQQNQRVAMLEAQIASLLATTPKAILLEFRKLRR